MEDEKICPICKKPNGCQSGEKTCWCYTIKVPRGLLETIPDEDRGKACVCVSCINKYKVEHNIQI